MIIFVFFLTVVFPLLSSLEMHYKINSILPFFFRFCNFSIETWLWKFCLYESGIEACGDCSIAES